MKYICTVNQTNGQEEIFTFPRHVNHDCMAEVLGRVKNHTHGNWERIPRTIISAGFVCADGVCHGESLTLDVKARPEDKDLLANQFRGLG